MSGPRLALYVCHCRECQKQSTSAFGISAIYQADGLRLERGSTAIWSRPTDSGRVLDCTFCAACGSRLWHANPGGETVSVKGGALDRTVDLAEACHIWTSRKLPGVIVPDGARQFPKEPEEE